MSRFLDPEVLTPGHDLTAFDSGIPSLDLWLTRHGLTAGAAGGARTYVVQDTTQGRVVGYHALATASVHRAEATSRAARGMPAQPIPAVLLARLAVDVTVRGRGVGAWLLRDAMLRALAAAESVGWRVLLVHALDEGARGFYLHHGLEPSPSDPLNLQMLIKDIRAAVDAA